MITIIYLIGVLLSFVWSIVYARLVNPNLINIVDIIFIVVASLCSWLAVMIYLLRLCCSNDYILIKDKWNKNKKSKKRTIRHLKVDD